MLEKDVERRLCRKVKSELGGTAFKFTSPGRRSVPDRVLVLPNGVVHFVEVKRPGGKLTPNQARTIEQFKALGQDVSVVYNYEDVDALIMELAA